MPIFSENNKVHASQNIARLSDVKRGHINRLLANLDTFWLFGLDTVEATSTSTMTNRLLEKKENRI